MRLRLGALALVGGLALLAAGCGGGGGAKVESGAKIVPAGVAGYLAIDTDTGSSQWKAAESLLDKFPGKQRLLDFLRGQLNAQGVDFERDVKPALGPELDVVFLDLEKGGNDFVGLTRPKDAGKLGALLKKGKQPSVSTKIDGWTVFADSQALLDKFKQARSGGRLADDKAFQAARADLPGEALARLYLSGASLQKSKALSKLGRALGAGKLTSIAAALVAKPDGLRLDGVIRSEGGAQIGAPYKSKLAPQLPSGALLYLSFKGIDKALTQLRSIPALQAQLPTVEAAVGTTLEEVAPLFAGEGALTVYLDAPIPAISLILEVADEAAALRQVDKIAARVATLTGNALPQNDTSTGVSARRIAFGQFAVYYATFEGKLVITSSPKGITGLRESGPKLEADPVFKEVSDAAGKPDETGALLYVNIKDALPLVENLAQIAGTALPRVATENLAPLRALLVYGTATDGKTTLTAFVEIK